MNEVTIKAACPEGNNLKLTGKLVTLLAGDRAIKFLLHRDRKYRNAIYTLTHYASGYRVTSIAKPTKKSAQETLDEVIEQCGTERLFTEFDNKPVINPEA